MKFVTPRADVRKPNRPKRGNDCHLSATPSNNTRMLEETAEKNGIKAIQIEDESDLDKYDFSGYETIGVTAGASTPETIIDNVIASLKAR